jgi:hypothetical protein
MKELGHIFFDLVSQRVKFRSNALAYIENRKTAIHKLPHPRADIIKDPHDPLARTDHDRFAIDEARSSLLGTLRNTL